MNHWIIVPVILPALLGSLIVLGMRRQALLQRVFAVGSGGVLLAVAAALMAASADGSIEVYDLGNWPAPFGIVLVLDRLSALMVFLTAILALAVLLYAIGTGWDLRGRNFHALFQFQLMGVCGAFLTGDAFNLFVFFEVLLIASYGLMIHGGGTRRLQAGVQYVVYNLLGSTLFLFALGTLYAVTGTLNMADMAVRVAELPASEIALLRVGAVLLLMVFAIKAAVLPLHFWLPETYANAPAPVAALFAIMTKVGAYSIIRMYTLVFGPELDATAGLFGPALTAAALLTLAVGMIGVLGADRLGRLAAFAVIGSMGTLLIAIAQFTQQATVAALYYMIHSTLAAAALFLVVDHVRERRQSAGDSIASAPPIAQNGLIASLFLTAGVAMAGMPPLSGFLGKLLVMDAVRASDQVLMIWSVILVTSLVAIVGFAQAGSMVFWRTAATDQVAPQYAAPEPVNPGLPLVASIGLLATVALLSVLAGPVTAYLEATAAQLFSPQEYIGAVIGAPEAEG